MNSKPNHGLVLWNRHTGNPRMRWNKFSFSPERVASSEVLQNPHVQCLVFAIPASGTGELVPAVPCPFQAWLSLPVQWHKVMFEEWHPRGVTEQPNA